MSSNGFLNVPELAFHCGWRLPFCGGGAAQLTLGFNTDIGWHIRLPHALQPVLLLRHRSFWLDHLVGLTVELDCGRRFALWAVRSADEEVAWRRMRVRFNCN
jgi:hypothetical protein